MRLNILSESINQNWTIERIVNESPPPTWEEAFKDAELELKHISDILQREQEKTGFFPLKKDIFAAFNYTRCPPKVVIVGQDPYPQSISINGIGVPRAVGMSFSVRKEDTIPSSLKNIYKELHNTVRGFNIPDHGDLTDWAKQGILLLNTCLTVRPGRPNSHDELWLGFINKILKYIAKYNPHCIYLLWGREAQKLVPLLGEKSIILEAAHPSGFSAARGFFGCNHFNMVNEILINQGKTAINWNLKSKFNTQDDPPPLSTSPTNMNLIPVNINNLTTIVTSSPKTEKKQVIQQKVQYPLPMIPTIMSVTKEVVMPMIKDKEEVDDEKLPKINPII